MLETLRHDGQPHETGWPYLVAVPADLSQWQPPAGLTPLFRRAGDAGNSTVDAILAELDHGRPVLVLMRLSRSFDWIGADHIVDPAANEQPEFLRRHAVVAVGHGEAKGQRAVLVRKVADSGRPTPAPRPGEADISIGADRSSSIVAPESANSNSTKTKCRRRPAAAAPPSRPVRLGPSPPESRVPRARA